MILFFIYYDLQKYKTRQNFYKIIRMLLHQIFLPTVTRTTNIFFAKAAKHLVFSLISELIKIIPAIKFFSWFCQFTLTWYWFVGLVAGFSSTRRLFFTPLVTKQGRFFPMHHFTSSSMVFFGFCFS